MILKKWLPILLLAALLLSAILAYVILDRTLLSSDEEVEDETLDLKGEEDELYGLMLLYGALERQQMNRITVKNGDYTYSFTREKEADASSVFIIEINGKEYDIDFDEEEFARLVVSVGKTMVEERLLENDALKAATEEERETIYAKYGLDRASDPNYFEVECFEKVKTADGYETVYKTYRVYVGNETVSGEGHYLRLDGNHAVYVSNSPTAGELTAGSPARFAKKTLQYAFVEGGAYLMRDVTFWRGSAEAGTVVGAEDALRIRYRLEENGVLGEERIGTVNLRTAGEVMQALAGQKVGKVDLTVTVPTDEENGELIYHVSEILSVDRLFLNYSFINESERDILHSGVVYRFDAPSEIKHYTANSDACMEVSELFAAFDADEIVQIGVDDETLDAYGLRAYTIYLEMPMDVSYSTEEGKTDDYVVSAYLPNYLYFSEVQEDGTCYVASMLYDVVGKVDASKLSFLFYDYFHWVNSYMYVVYFTDVTKISFDLGYADRKKTYSFDISCEFNESDELTGCRVVYCEGNRVIEDFYDFTEIYAILTQIQYLGMYGGTPEEKADVIQENNRLMTISVTVVDGRTTTYSFYAYEERHSLVCINGGAHFTTLSRYIKKIAEDLAALEAGKKTDADMFY